MKPYPNYQDLEHSCGVTWNELTALEPRLAELLWAARRGGAGCRHWGDVEGIFSPLRNRLSELVGFAGEQQRHPVLGSTGAYQVAYWKLYDAVAGLLPSHNGAETAAAERPTTESSGHSDPILQP